MNLNPNYWDLVGEMNKLQKLKEENALLNKEIKRINSEKIKCDKDIKAMTREKNLYLKDIDAITRAKHECQKELTVVRANFDLRSDQNEKVLREKIAVLNKKNEQLEERYNKIIELKEGESRRNYQNSIRKSISNIQKSRSQSQSGSVKGGKTNKKIKSKRKNTRKRF